MTPTDPAELPLLDRDTIDELKDIMEDEFGDLVETFLCDLSVQLDAIRAAIDGENPEALRNSAHKLKSGSGSIGALRLAEIVRQLEVLGHSGIIAGTGPLWQQARNTAEQTRSAFRALLQA